MKILKLLMLCCCYCLSGLSQNEADLQKPRMVPPSADAAALGKYGQIPVDKSTGIPNISIPLYEIKTPRFNLPISLSYHASGIKVEEISSWVGAGWVLNAGGVITRSIIGYADDYGGSGFLNNLNRIKPSASISWPADILYISDVVNKRLDTEPDNFFFNVNQHSGSFAFGLDGKPVITPYQPVKINYNFTPAAGLLDFTLTDEEGNFYNFGARETVTSSITSQLSGGSSWYLTKMVSADLSDTIKFNYTTDATLQTELGHNFSQDLTDLCNNGITTLKPMLETLTSRTFYSVRLSSIIFKGGRITFSTSAGRLDDGIASLDSVKVFNIDYATNQYSLVKSFKLDKDYFYSGNPNPTSVTPSTKNKYRLKLTGVQQIDKNNIVIGNYQLVYNTTLLPPVFSYAQDKWGYYNGKNLNQSLLEAKQFTYQPTYNASPVAVTLGDGRGADRSTSETYMKAGILEKITYPTGGYTVFDYQSNKLKSIVYTTNTFTVAAIGANNSSGSVETNTQIYTPTGSMLNTGGNVFTIKISKGNLPAGFSSPPYVTITDLSTGGIIYNKQADVNEIITFNLTAGTQYQIKTFADGNDNLPSSSSPYAVVSVTYKVPGGFTNVDVGGLRISSIRNYTSNGSIANTETYTYGINDEAGAGTEMAVLNSDFFNRGTVCTNENYGGYTLATTTTYSNNSHYPLSTLNGSPVGYPMVTVYQGDATQNIGKTVYKYDIFKDNILVPPFTTVIKPIPVKWKNGDPVWVGNFRNGGNGQYSIVSEDIMSYTLSERAGAKGTVIQFAREPIGDYSTCDYFGSPTIDNALGYPRVFSGGGMCEWNLSWFYWYDYPISTGSRVLSQKTSKLYNLDGSLSVSAITKYYYDNLTHMFPTRIETISSEGNGSSVTKIKKLKYSQDIAGAVQTAMVNKNMLTPVLEEKVYESVSGTETLLSTVQTDYRQAGNLIVKDKVKASINSNTPENRVLFNQYDASGNILEQRKNNDIPNSYIWDYRSAYPVAEVINGSQANVAYTSFESDGKGNWNNYTGLITTDLTAPTGKKFYNLTTTATLSKTVTNGQTYIVSYWRNSTSAYTINGGIQVTYQMGRSIGAWTFHKHFITATTTTLTIAGTGGIDEVRLYPSTAQMTTYTYDPLIGMTNQCDVNNKIYYYEYDGFQRLSLIRDQDKNIVKKICYNYAGQPENCLTYPNDDKSGNYTRTCSAGYIGSTVYVNIPQGMFNSGVSVADANNMATAYGQAQANTTGTCTDACSFSSVGVIMISSSTISKSVNTVNFSISFGTTSSSVVWADGKQVAAINGTCKPSVPRTFNLAEGTTGRNWEITVSTAGSFTVKLISGTAPSTSTMITLSGSFSL